MIVTLVLSVLLMAALFLLLLAGVGFIQDLRFLTSAPREVLAVVKPRGERFRGAHAIGWALGILSILMFVFAFVYGGYDGVKRGYSFWQFFLRFALMLYLLKAFDILFFDFVLLCRSGFFPHFYPECRSVLGPHLFGYNKTTHIRHIVLTVPISLLMSWVCTLF